MSIPFTLLLGLLLDHFLGEPARFHPLILFGKFANYIERKLNSGSNKRRFYNGIIAWGILVLPIPLGYLLLVIVLPYHLLLLVNIYIVYWAVALNSLNQHGMQIYRPLKANNIKQARYFCSYIVSRDTDSLDEVEISRATTESMLENGHDGVTATLIYFVIGGAPLVIIHRLSNTLDAMWGYRNSQFNYFGKCSARMDDVLGFISGKITCLLYSLIGLFKGRLKCALYNAFWQSRNYKSHNGGWVMASGATVLNVCLGGKSVYFGASVESPKLGQGEKVNSKHIKASLFLVKKAVLLWLSIVFVWFSIGTTV